MHRVCKNAAAWARKVIIVQNGTVTIFITIIFLTVIVLGGLFIDLARIKIAQNQLKRTVNASARSVMAEYNVELRKSYGIFGTARRDFNSEFRKYVQANISLSGQQNLNLLDTRYETGNIILFQSLSSDEVIKQQILEAMKYKAPVEIGREIINKFMQLRNTAAFFDESNENRKSISRINKKTETLHETNQKIKRHRSELEKSKLELEDIKRKLEMERDSRRIRELTEEREQLENQMNRLRSGIEAELHKAQRAALEIEVELRKIKDNKPQDIYKNNDPQNSTVTGTGQEDEGEVANEIKNRLKSVEKTLQGVQTEIAVTREALRKEAISKGINLISSMGIDSASKAYEEINVFWNKSYQQGPGELEVNATSEQLRDQYPELSRHFNIVPVKRGINDFESSDSEKADSIVGFLRKLFGAINVKEKFIDARDEMYINEYVLTYFSNLTSGAKGDAEYPYSNTEAEYICFGKNPFANAVAELYFTRFALDSAGYFAFTKGIPELTLRAIFSLAMAALQASVDTVKLIALNEPVPIVSVHPENPLQNITLTYKDHLRLFLLLNSDESTKLGRIKEIFISRSAIDPRDMYTLSAGTATISVRLWFLPMTGIRNMEKGPFGTKIIDGRCFITKDVEFGY